MLFMARPDDPIGYSGVRGGRGSISELSKRADGDTRTQSLLAHRRATCAARWRITVGLTMAETAVSAFEFSHHPSVPESAPLGTGRSVGTECGGNAEWMVAL